MISPLSPMRTPRSRTENAERAENAERSADLDRRERELRRCEEAIARAEADLRRPSDPIARDLGDVSSGALSDYVRATTPLSTAQRDQINRDFKTAENIREGRHTAEGFPTTPAEAEAVLAHFDGLRNPSAVEVAQAICAAGLLARGR